MAWLRWRYLLKNKPRQKIFVIVLLMAIMSIFLVYFLSKWSEKKALFVAEGKAQNVLAYHSSNLVAHLNKFRLLTALVSKRPDVINMFHLNKIEGVESKDNRLASITTGLSGAKDFWFVAKGGDVFFSSNKAWLDKNVSNESYYEAAFQGRLGRSGSVSEDGFRSYIFASPVFIDEKVVGLVAVRVDLEVVERVWGLLPEPIVAAEPNGRILLSNVEPWRLKYFPPLKENNRELMGDAIDNGQLQLINLYEPIKGNPGKQYLAVTSNVPVLQWQVHVLMSLAPVKRQRLMTTLISSLFMVLLILLVWMLLERRRRMIERDRDRLAFSLRLERKVRVRTRELMAANALLESEVVERRSAEKALRETQQDLLQAAKLAGIGQMSAALAHEYNQPLAAIRSYADNAQQLLSLKNEASVRDNLTRITSLTERMADLTKTLRSFAHKPEVISESVSLSQIMDEMIILLSPQAKKQHVDLVVLPPPAEVNVLAGHLRLSQVVINLVTNAMDAVKESAKKRVEVSWNNSQDYAEVFVKDSGNGISEELKDKIFTAFFTTKGAGVGLGLGLFIVYNMVKEFQGSIELLQQEGYGAVFYIKLPLAKNNSIEPLSSNDR